LIIDSTKFGFNAGLRAARLARVPTFVAQQQLSQPVYERRFRHDDCARTAQPRIRMNARAAIRSAKKNRAAKNSRAVSS
jgi:hypothetical protein